MRIQEGWEVGVWGTPKAVPVPVGWAPELVLHSYWPNADHARGAPTREWFSGGSLAGTQRDLGCITRRYIQKPPARSQSFQLSSVLEMVWLLMVA